VLAAGQLQNASSIPCRNVLAYRSARFAAKPTAGWRASEARRKTSGCSSSAQPSQRGACGLEWNCGSSTQQCMTSCSRIPVIKKNSNHGRSCASQAAKRVIRSARSYCEKQITAYLGLVPLEGSSGNGRRLGHISKQKSSILRFLLVEVTARGIPESRISTCMRCPFTRAFKIPRRGTIRAVVPLFAPSSRKLPIDRYSWDAFTGSIQIHDSGCFRQSTSQ
jgi:hypothetical protein